MTRNKFYVIQLSLFIYCKCAGVTRSKATKGEVTTILYSIFIHLKNLKHI